MTEKTSVLLTGGAGYIGSHTYVALVQAGYQPVILDDFSNSDPAVLARLQRITGQPVPHHRGNVADAGLVQALLEQHKIQAVIHFAGFKAVGESVAQPLKYFENNLGGMVGLLQAMDAAGCRTLVFSSSATVYGDPASVPITEDFPRSHTNPYGQTKLVCEDMLTAMRVANPAWHMGVLRYFNPVGAHPSGLIGEDPAGPPNNLMPYVAQVAVGKRPFLQVFGNDYATPDGTGVRDYIHVQDLAQAHVAAVQTLLQKGESFTVNVGTGRGYSVLEVVHAFEQASGKPVPYQFVPRRSGDVAQCYANAALAQSLLGWTASETLASMCADAWRWQSSNPDGYRS
ncbi:UDP-glucose 4-epimerase GalE [Rhodoferax saidenbachensis]|uniref:UDP-glucose 4-epimerase n=1 Tax=Rhodoferax saidenbachensis TaxID=1484693 RepID=A0A1P8K7F7_9BURK|nr:UDP-glucose 4-epimerase GalE [Rhodoferax saidenbachensis]APW41933.1 UDP-glucose 4-epimerase GalE [Rhodoferax saidenbachensis]